MAKKVKKPTMMSKKESALTTKRFFKLCKKYSGLSKEEFDKVFKKEFGENSTFEINYEG